MTLKEFIKWLESEDRQNWEVERVVEDMLKIMKKDQYSVIDEIILEKQTQPKEENKCICQPNLGHSEGSGCRYRSILYTQPQKDMDNYVFCKKCEENPCVCQPKESWVGKFYTKFYSDWSELIPKDPSQARQLWCVIDDFIKNLLEEQRQDIISELRHNMPELCDKCEPIFTKTTAKMYKN